MRWLPLAKRRKEWLKINGRWMAIQRGWPSKRPFCAILFYASPRVSKAFETAHKEHARFRQSTVLPDGHTILGVATSPNVCKSVHFFQRNESEPHHHHLA